MASFYAAKANGPLGEATVSGSDMWLPTSRVLYRNDVAGHELGHNLGLRNCSSCNSIMTNSSRYKDVKATLQDIKTLYNGYR
ncbi:matrixin family metalloprotease [Shewanella sp. HL-SH5]|uniref:matrixin family metalloprotease n=1 Tax=Shewanella sp. HL-SH5 TaxID=3436241 RepID=UPI003EBCC3D0